MDNIPSNNADVNNHDESVIIHSNNNDVNNHDESVDDIDDDDDDAVDDDGDKNVDFDDPQVEEEECSGGAGQGGNVGQDCSETETVCDTVETEECYTKWVKHYNTLRMMRLRLLVTLLRLRRATQSMWNLKLFWWEWWHRDWDCLWEVLHKVSLNIFDHDDESDETPYTDTEIVCDTVETVEYYTKWVKL